MVSNQHLITMLRKLMQPHPLTRTQYHALVDLITELGKEDKDDSK